MKKSEQFRAAARAVLLSERIMPDSKLEIIKTLLSEEASAEYWEKKEEEK